MGQAPRRFEAAADQAPAVWADGSVCCWDGRLDNRDSLFLAGSRGRSLREFNSAMAALEAYRTGGIAGLRSLIGDWSLAIRDAKSNSVVLASDYVGMRPLYYRRDAHGVRWSSSLANLVEWTGAADLDEEYAVRTLMCRPAPRLTPYSGIYPVPPGHAIRISPEGFSVEKFWRLPVHQEIRFQDERDYEEALRDLFREAVKARLPGGAPPCAELSGGLDSSSIVCMSERLLAPGKPITFSYVHAGSRDERYIAAVERACGIEGTRFDLRDIPLLTATQTGGAAPSLGAPKIAVLARRMEDLGSGVLLTGQTGDFVMGNLPDDCEQVIDRLEQGRYREAAREALGWSRVLHIPVYAVGWRVLLTKWSGWTAPNVTEAFSGRPGRFTHMDSLTPRVRKRISAVDADGHRAEWEGAMPSRRRRFRMLSNILESRVLQTPEGLAHLSWSHPYMHRPLVEFMLTIPASQVCRPNEPRRLMRRAFAPLLPEAIAKRRSKAGYEQPFREALLPLAAALLAEPGKILVAEAGWVEHSTLLERLQRFSQGLECNDLQLRQILLLEFWMRNREGAGQTLEGTTSSTVVPFPGALDMEKAAPI